MNTNRIFLMLLFLVFTSFKSPGKTADHYSIQIKNSNDTFPCFLAISDIHLDYLNEQKDIIFHNSNAGYDLWDAAKKGIDSIVGNHSVRFLLVPGDLSLHAVPNAKANGDTGFARAYTDLENIAQKAKIPLIIAPGNNDQNGIDYGKLYAVHPPFFIPNNTTACYGNDSNVKFGYYSVYPFGKDAQFKIIVLNTVIFSSDKRYGPDKATDSNNELRWFENELKNSKTAEKILVAMHIPPEFDNYKTFCDDKNNKDHNRAYNWLEKDVENKFLDLLNQYRQKVVGVISSHTHMDGFALLKTDQNNTGPLFISIPAVTPGHGNNPSVKLIEYNDDDFTIKDFTTYYMNCSDGKCSPDKMNWNSSFSFKGLMPDYEPSKEGMLQYIQAKIQSGKDAEIKQLQNKIYTAYGAPHKPCEDSISIYINSRTN